MKILMLLLLVACPAQAEVIHQMESNGEDKEVFLLDVAKWMQRWTKRNEAEACGYVIQRDGYFAVIVETQHRRDECLSGVKYAGWSFTGDTIHSHPLKRLGRNVLVQNHADFSDTDYKTSGYLVSGGMLYHQNGEGTERKIGLVEIEP